MSFPYFSDDEVVLGDAATGFAAGVLDDAAVPVSFFAVDAVEASEPVLGRESVR
jgi:hypothetical protein